MYHEASKSEILEYLKTLTLLCVEDNKTTQLLYEDIFEDIVQEIFYAYDGEEGYEKFIAHEIDIVISDHNMPKLNGLEMIAKIRGVDKSVPIIFASGIEDVDIVINALKFDVNSFIKKPIQKNEIIKSIENSAKLLIANDVLHKEKEKALYNSYQEDMGFEKELNILRNDFYYQMINKDRISLVDFLYHPLDILSGDAYCARRIDENVVFYLMVDGMGKGISASLTAMIMTSFINHVIDKMLETDSFDLAVLVNETIEYIKPILLDEEALAIDYILMDDEQMLLYYAKFAMPVLLMQNDKREILRIKSNNPPLSKWQDTFNINSYDISNINKFLIYSDGIVENETIYDAKVYGDFIEEDFSNSFTREDMKNSFFKKIQKQEDDISLIYIHKLKSSSVDVASRSFATSLDALEEANEWYAGIWEQFSDNENSSYKASLVFTELYMNAYEHGNLGITASVKHNLLEDDIYFETLIEKEKGCTKVIDVRVNKVQHELACYVITQITDEGEGFDTQILSKIFRNSATFNGRGVFVSRKNSFGIYYNAEGNSVLFLNKV